MELVVALCEVDLQVLRLRTKQAQNDCSRIACEREIRVGKLSVACGDAANLGPAPGGRIVSFSGTAVGVSGGGVLKQNW